MGSEWGIKEIPGILETATFPLRMRGASKAYAFGDAQSENINWPILMYVANQTNDKELAAYRKTATNNTTLVDVSNWVSDTSDALGIDSFEPDIYHKSNATVIMKKGWNSADTSVAFHGGANNDGHGHWDIGSFQFDMSGVHFGVDLPREHYNLRDKGHYNMDTAKEMYPDGCSFTGGHYYRQKAEGHNTIVANRQVTNAQDPTSSKSYDVNGKATSKFLDMQFGDTESFAILNMTETNDIYDSAVRGVKLIKTGSSSNGIIIQDEIHAKTPTDFLWSMHTAAETITLNNDKQVTLAQTITVDGTDVTRKIVLKIISDDDYKFELLPAKFDETYGTKVKPPLESPNDPAECPTAGDDCETHVGYCSDTKYQKIAIRTAKGEDVKDFEIAVAIYPSGRVAPKFVPLELWGK